MPSAPNTNAREPERSALPHRRARLAGGAGDPEAVVPLDLLEVAGEVRHDRDRQMLDRARGRAADRRGHERRAVRRDDDARRSRALGAPAHGAEVPRVAHLVETGEERAVGRGELVGVGVLVGLAPREHALVVARAGGLGDVPLELHVHARLSRLAQPGLALDRALGRPELEHLAPARGAPRARAGGRRPARASLGDERSSRSATVLHDPSRAAAISVAQLVGALPSPCAARVPRAPRRAPRPRRAAPCDARSRARRSSSPGGAARAGSRAATRAEPRAPRAY